MTELKIPLKQWQRARVLNSQLVQWKLGEKVTPQEQEWEKVLMQQLVLPGVGQHAGDSSPGGQGHGAGEGEEGGEEGEGWGGGRGSPGSQGSHLGPCL